MFRSKLKSYYEFYRNQGVIENFKFTDKVFHRRSIEFPVFIDKRLSTHNPNKISNNPSEWLPSEKLKLTLTLHYYLIHPVHNNNLKFEKSCSSWEKVHTHTDLIFSNRVIHAQVRKRKFRFLSKMQTRLQGIRFSSIVARAYEDRPDLTT